MQYLKLLRPTHWAKNGFLFIPLFFAGEIFNLHKLLPAFWGFLAFSLAASAVYVINDYKDLEADRAHPIKCNRPLASGAVSKPAALVLFAVCLLAAFSIAWFIKLKFLAVLGAYFLMNVAYTFGLKNVSILDILILAAGFVFRIKCGGIATDIAISEWLVIMVFLLALFLAVAKRRDDVLIKLQSGKDMRKAVKGYNLDFMNVMLAVVSAIIIVAYLMYTLAPETMIRFKTYRLYYTCLFVIAGLLRYLQVTYVESDTGSPTKILYKDRFIQATIVLWILSFYVILYLPTDKSFFQ